MTFSTKVSLLDLSKILDPQVHQSVMNCIYTVTQDVPSDLNYSEVKWSNISEDTHSLSFNFTFHQLENKINDYSVCLCHFDVWIVTERPCSRKNSLENKVHETKDWQLLVYRIPLHHITNFAIISRFIENTSQDYIIYITRLKTYITLL